MKMMMTIQMNIIVMDITTTAVTIIVMIIITAKITRTISSKSLILIATPTATVTAK